MASSFLEQKAKKQAEKLEKEYGPSAYGGTTWLNEQLSGKKKKKKKKDDDIAPVRTTTKKEEDEDGLDLFQKGVFEDGYQAWDVSKAILGTLGDATVGAIKGVSKMAEGIVDAGAYGVAGIADRMGNDDFADRLRVKARENAIDNAFEETDSYLDQYSLLGRTSDAVAEGLGQVGAIILTGGIAGAAGLGAVGATAATTGVMGVSSIGSGMSEAYEGGATDEEAATYGLIKGVVDAGSELIFGGLGKTVKALGISRGLSSLDDMFAQKLASKIANQTAKNFVEYGVKASAEGVEEVLAGLGSAVGKKLTYMDDEELSTLVRDENLLEQFVVGTVSSGIAQSGIVPGMKGGSLRESNATGRDFISGLSENEQKVVDKVVADRVAEAEKSGNVSEKEKSKIYDEVLEEMEKGYLSTDTIEEVLGGDTYKSYQATVKNEDSLRETFNELNKMKQGEMTGEQIDLRNDLKEQLKEMESKGERNQLKSRLDSEVMSLVKGDRLIESYNERSRRGQAFEADLTKYNEKQQEVIKRAAESGILNNTRRTHEFVDMVAKISADKGVLFDFTDNQKLKDSGFAVDGKQVNGYVTKDGVTLNVNSAKSLNSVVGHEITHVLEGTELYDTLRQTVFEYAKTKGEYDSRIADLTNIYKNVKDADVEAELTADLVGDYLFTDADFINNLSANNRNVFQKIYDEIKYLCKVATAGSKEARELEKVKRAFDKAYRDGGKAKTKTQYSMSDSGGKQLTKEQQEYFKDSKVRDENGNLLKVYHGSKNSGFNVFQYSEDVQTGTDYGEAYYFTSDRQKASGYSYDVNKDERVAQYKKEKDALREKFLQTRSEEDKNAFLNYTLDGKSLYDLMGDESYLTDGGEVKEVYLNLKNPLIVDASGKYYYEVYPDYFEQARANGNDGIIVKNVIDNPRGEARPIDTYIAFSPNQIKNTDNAKPTADKDIRYSLTEYSDAEKKAHNKAVVDHFGKTYKWAETGYVLLDGTKLDLSGKHDGAPGGYRTVDHRDIVAALGDDYGDGSYSGSLVQFMSEGNIRISPESDGINLSVKPTKAQEQALADFISRARGEVLLDIDGLDGYTEVSVEYPRGTHSSKVLNDIREWFDNGKKPEVSSTSQFYFSLSEEGAEPKTYGNYNFYGKDMVLAPVSNTANAEPNATSNTANANESVKVPVAENEPTTIEHSVSDLADIAKQGRRENMRGAYTHNGKQYLSDGSFIAEFDTVDESLEQSNEFPIKQAIKELDEAFERRVDGNYDLHTSDTKGFIKVGNSLFGSNRVNALIRAIENPVFSLANVRGGHEALLVTGDNGRAVLMPVRASGNAYLVYEAEPIAETANFPDDLAPVTEDNTERLDSLTDTDAPPEMDAPITEEVPFENGQAVEVEDPFENRDVPYGNEGKKVHAYMYDNPEVKPFFQAEAYALLEELNNGTKGERWYNDHLWYESGGEEGFGGTKRHQSESIDRLSYEFDLSYEEIEKGLNAIIEDHGAENIAAAKKIEFVINDRLMYGYKPFGPMLAPDAGMPNQDYIALMQDKQRVDSLTDADAPPISEEIVEDIAPVAPAPMKRDNPVVTEKYEAIKPKPQKDPKLARATPEEQATANVLTEEPEVPKKKGGIRETLNKYLIDPGMVFERLSLETGNQELQAKYKSIGRSDRMAQRFMEKSLKPIIERVDNSGKTKQFYEYLYHMHNADRMTLAQRYEDTPNKPVFGDAVTADVSKNAAAKLLNANPEFKQWAEEIYKYNRHNRELLVEGGVISRELADHWEKMYPHYVPIRRVGDTGLNVTVPLDTGRTGVNAPVKRATGGSRDILPLFDTMGQRTMQTYRAVAKNRFGVELKNTLGKPVENEAFDLDEVIDSIDYHEELLKKGENGKAPTFTVFDNGEKVTFEITDEMYEAMQPATGELAKTYRPLNFLNNLRRGLLTEYNPTFFLTNPIKDTQDVIMNSQHPARTYANYPKAIAELMGKHGRWYQEYMDNGGDQITYFERDTNTFAKDKSTLRKVVGFPLDKISDINNFIERVPRMAEYIASRKMGRSIDVSMLDAARVTTDFSAGGHLTKYLNRNGATFFNASVQGAAQQVRNIREAKANGLKGWATLAAKFAVAGLPALMLNHLMWDDDEEYEELSDYVKQNYYIVGKYGDGKFVRIPKGRALAVIQNAFEQIENLVTGEDDVDLATFGELVLSNLAPNNPLDNNIAAPILQAWGNRAWYGDEIVPTRLQDLPAVEQYDETTDSISRWLSEKADSVGIEISPYKINYLLDQYSGGVGDMALPYLTPEAERGKNSALAPLADKFTTDSVMKNQNVSDFYDTKDKLAKNANGSDATDEDILMSKYMNSINSELSQLYADKREVQNMAISDEAKYRWVREIQEEIVELTRESLATYDDVSISDGYAKVGNRHFRWYVPEGETEGEWRKLTNDQLEKQEEVTSALGIEPDEYWANKEEYDYAYEKPEKYALAKAVGGYTAFRGYSSDLYDIKADKDSSGKSISGSRKAKVLAYINNLDIDYGERLILFKSEYNADDTYNMEIIEYLNSRADISYEDMVAILKELGFTVTSDGTVYWD